MRGRIPKAKVRIPGQADSVMNKTEQRYAREVLHPMLLAGEISWYGFEPWKLQLAYRTTFSVDFGIVRHDGRIECHEVKAVWSTGKAGYIDDARVKIKMAAQAYPFFDFIVAAYKSASRKKRTPAEWLYEPIKCRVDWLTEEQEPGPG